MGRFAHPTSEPAEFKVLELPEAEGHYVTIVVRNHRVVQVGGTAAAPVLARQFLGEDEFRALTDAILEEVTVLDGPSLCFVGDGFDPSSVGGEDDEEALEHSEAWAAVFFVAPDELPALRQAVSAALVDHGHPNAWVMPCGVEAEEMVVRAADHLPGTHRRASDDFYWYMAIPFPHRADGTMVDPSAPAVRAELGRRIDNLDDITLLRCFRRALEAVPGFDPGDGTPAEAMRRVLHDVPEQAYGYGCQELTSRLCLEGTTFVLAGDMNSFMSEDEFYARFAALQASGVADAPFADEAPAFRLPIDPALSRVGDLVAWYASVAAEALSGTVEVDPDLGERLAAHLAEREDEVVSLLRAAALAEHHE